MQIQACQEVKVDRLKTKWCFRFPEPISNELCMFYWRVMPGMSPSVDRTAMLCFLSLDIQIKGLLFSVAVLVKSTDFGK